MPYLCISSVIHSLDCDTFCWDGDNATRAKCFGSCISSIPFSPGKELGRHLLQCIFLAANTPAWMRERTNGNGVRNVCDAFNGDTQIMTHQKDDSLQMASNTKLTRGSRDMWLGARRREISPSILLIHKRVDDKQQSFHSRRCSVHQLSDCAWGTGGAWGHQRAGMASWPAFAQKRLLKQFVAVSKPCASAFWYALAVAFVAGWARCQWKMRF